eukprot:312945_1
MSFDFTSKSCAVRIPTEKVQMDSTALTEHAEEEYESDDFDKLLDEIDTMSSNLQIPNIKSEWAQLNRTMTNGNALKPHSKPHKQSSKSRLRLQSCDNSVEHCLHIQRIVFLLRIYALYLNYQLRPPLHMDDESKTNMPSSVTQIIDILDDYDRIAILNDYHHIKQNHLNHNEMHELRSYVKRKSIPCEDVKLCICCNRNQENNQIYKHLSAKTRRDLYMIEESMKDCSKEEMNEINIQKYLDIIHSTLIHQTVSDNMNYKFTTHIKPMSDTDSPTDEHTTHDTGSNSDYDLSVDDEGAMDGVTVYSPDDTVQDLLYNLSDMEYKFGESFSYWNPKCFDYIAPKHKDLETELLCQGMSSDDYKLLCCRATDVLQTEYGLNMMCRRQFSWMHRSVNYSDNMSIEHMIAVMIHTNYMELRDSLIHNQCKMSNEHESLEDVKQKHQEIAHFCRLLKETVFCFGDSFGDRARLFHGIDCKLLFSETCFSFNLPISTTIKYSIAPISSHGICVKLGKPLLPNLKNYYFDVTNMSQFPDEKERLVFGGEAMGFLDIIYNGHSHSEQMMSLRLFQQMVTGNWFANNKELMKTKYQRRIIKMIHSFTSQHNTNDNDYIVQMFGNIIVSKLRDHTMWINREEIALCLSELRELLLNQFHPYLTKAGYETQLRFCDVLEMNLSKKQIELSSFRKSIYSKLYTFRLNETHKMSFVFRCFQKYDDARKENVFRGFIAIKYLPKGHNINKVEMRYGLYFPQKEKLSNWE